MNRCLLNLCAPVLILSFLSCSNQPRYLVYSFETPQNDGSTLLDESFYQANFYDSGRIARFDIQTEGLEGYFVFLHAPALRGTAERIGRSTLNVPAVSPVKIVLFNYSERDIYIDYNAFYFISDPNAPSQRSDNSHNNDTSLRFDRLTAEQYFNQYDGLSMNLPYFSVFPPRESFLFLQRLPDYFDDLSDRTTGSIQEQRQLEERRIEKAKWLERYHLIRPGMEVRGFLIFDMLPPSRLLFRYDRSAVNRDEIDLDLDVDESVNFIDFPDIVLELKTIRERKFPRAESTMSWINEERRREIEANRDFFDIHRQRRNHREIQAEVMMEN